MRFVTVLPSLVVLVGATVSNVIDVEQTCSDATHIGLIVPAAGAGNLEVSNDGVNWATLLALTAGAKVLDIPFKWLRVTLTAAASGSDVAIGMSKQWES